MMPPKVLYAWDKPWQDPHARLWMGVAKLPAGQGFRRLVPGDDPMECRYCGGSLIYKYPHGHTKAEYEKEHGKV